jgi:hypothetical protein
MLIPRADSIGELALPAGTSTGASPKPSENECEVIHLFEEFRNPLLRYVVSRGLSLHDGEEIIQEVFLALFRHLQLGKSRRNLRGWVFRVAHNLALKQHSANKRALATFDSDETLAQRQPAATLNPEEEAASSQRQERMQAVLRARPLLPLPARGGAPLSRNSRHPGDFAGRSIDRAHSVPGAYGPGGRRMMPC